MLGSPLNILQVFVEYPGDLLFFLVVIVISQASLLVALGQRARFPRAQATQRYALASATLFGLWALMLAAALLAISTSTEPGRLLPPLERLAQTLSITVLAWAFLTADAEAWNKAGNLSIREMVIIILLFYVYTTYTWYGAFDSEVEFNGSNLAPVWSALPASVAFAGLAFCLFRSGEIMDAPLKGLFFLFVLLGNGWDLVRFSEEVLAGSYLGGARLAYMGGLALLPLLLYRQAMGIMGSALAAAEHKNALTVSSTESGIPDAKSALEGLKVATDAEHEELSSATDTLGQLEAIARLFDGSDPTPLPQRIVQSTVDILDVELCLLLRKTGEERTDVVAGYDGLKQERIAGVSLDLDELPALRQALSIEATMALPTSAQGEELSALSQKLEIQAIDNVFLQKVTSRAFEGSFLLVSSSLPTGMSPREIDQLGGLSTIAGQLLDMRFGENAGTLFPDLPGSTSLELDRSGGEISREEILAGRRQLAQGFEQDAEILAEARLARSESWSLLQDAQKRLLNRLEPGPDVPGITQELSLLFAEFSRLIDACDQRATALIEAETIKALADAQGEDLDPVLGAYLQMTLKQLEKSPKRLQKQLDALGSTQPDDADDLSALIDRLREETGELESELASLGRDLSATASELDALGIDPNMGGMAQALIQVLVDRKVFGQKLAMVGDERDHLAEALSRRQMDVDDHENTRQELKALHQEHEILLHSREEMRRAVDDLHVGLEAKAGEALALEKEIGDLHDQLLASASRQENMRRNIIVITEERDNLLKIRDQLTKRIADALADNESTNTEALSRQIDQLRATVADLTAHRQQLEEQLQDLAAQLDSSSKSSVEGGAKLVAEIKRLSSDLQTPMTALSQATEILITERLGILGAAQLKLLQQVSGNIALLAQIVRELNLVAMLPDDDFALQYHPADFMALLDEALTRHSQGLRQKHLTIDLSLSDRLPEIPMDAECVKEIVNQLLGNAIQVSSEKSQITLVVELDRIRAPEGASPVEVLRFSVKDSGEGIRPEAYDRVFARMYRADNPKIAGLGDTGVGLAVSRAIARAHGGELWITSEPGSGSVFHLALPVSPAQTIED